MPSRLRSVPSLAVCARYRCGLRGMVSNRPCVITVGRRRIDIKIPAAVQFGVATMRLVVGEVGITGESYLRQALWSQKFRRQRHSRELAYFFIRNLRSA
jgi:hypothetical protein